ncbi:NifB/NifX family molybdenum-iron cluster-binding protein [Archaeoglobus veneficus]|uniref:Dinitrogenase iron-molybdenum cofactor biosynthesis protein n=1 Tax=Archaeoglobus veneficus (strain DSM 11195 / SNP6) TaxID=693661 RepID=F2KQA5_ARCVS|nr:NifB/NifX family molybdenum-iron cluster-binding protein [Archaeoglobus veneficus]AEA46538.1 Dinitrogenase iron-molybdenum cofactor biosynthesis protein [Archaeoglobus veneficus SNP6]
MRICIPTEGKGGLDDYVCQHFGRAASFTIYDTETGRVEVIPNTSEHFGGVGKPPEIIARAKADVVVCGNLGPKAIIMLEQLGIKVYSGASGRVKDVVEQFLSGSFAETSVESACREHKHF